MKLKVNIFIQNEYIFYNTKPFKLNINVIVVLLEIFELKYYAVTFVTQCNTVKNRRNNMVNTS